MRLAGEWGLWEWFCLRAPGFAATDVQGLNASQAVAATDTFEQARRALDEARAVALAAVEAIVPPTKATNKAARALRRGELPVGELPPDVDALLGPVRAADAAARERRQAADAAFAADSSAVAAFLAERARDSTLREALLWQNRDAVHNSISSMLRRPITAEDSKTREQRRLVASAIQRYSVKNDTIGFFGPVGWGRFAEREQAISMRGGSSLTRQRRVYFEYWAIDALAQKLAQEPAVRPHLRPRRTPSIWVDGVLLHHPNGKRIELPALYARLLHLADGQRTAAEIARVLVAEHAAEIESETDAFALLDQLVSRKLCTWTIEIPTATFEPEAYLRAALADVPEPARGEALAQLAALEQRRDELAAAAGSDERVDAALGALESTFTELTATSATRKGGETYAGRTLVFEDCLRDLDVELGATTVARLGPPLALVLQSARWYTYEIARRYQAAFRRVYRQLRDAQPDGTVPYQQFRDQLKDLFPGPQVASGIAHDVAEELRQRWEAILAIGATPTRLVTRTSSELAEAIATTFAAPGPGWPSARHHAPDLMIAAASAEAIARGELQFVLGEVHVGFNTVTLPCLAKEHPDPQQLVMAREQDLPAPGIAPVWSKARNRADLFSLSRHDLELETGETRSARPREQVLAIGALVVDEADGMLVVRSRDDGRTFPLIAFVEQHLIAESFARFRFLERRAHSPRIVIDDLVIQRESWRFPAEQLLFATEASDLDRFAAARRFAREHGMPQSVFIKADAEAKPFYVDFRSPTLLDVFARQVRRSKNVVISEMLPDLEACWLTDGNGARYTSELRIAVCDPVPWSPELLKS